MATLQDVLTTIVELRAAKGKAKLEILKANVENTILSTYLYLVYGVAEHNFYQTTIDENAANGIFAPEREDLTIDKLVAIKDRLNTRGVTGNAAKIELSTLWAASDDAGRALIKLMLARDIEAGVGQATINKAWPGLVKIVPYMRCVLPTKAKLPEWDWAKGVFSQLKCDGMYANADVYPLGDVRFSSRNGSSFPSSEFGDLIVELRTVFDRVDQPFQEPIQMQGELLVYEDGVLLPREQSNGVMNSVLQGDVLKPNQRIHYVVWDVIPLVEATAKNTFERSYSDRFTDLLLLLGARIDNPGVSYLSAVPTRIVHSYEEALEDFQKRLAEGEEGTVIKEPNSPWIDGDSPWQVKLKTEAEIELRLTGLNAAAKGKNVSTFGSLQLASECGELEVGCTGIADALRLWIYNNREALIGNAIIGVKCNGIMHASEEGKKHSIFLPRVIEIRKDKTVANTFQEIKDIFAALIAKK